MASLRVDLGRLCLVLSPSPPKIGKSQEMVFLNLEVQHLRQACTCTDDLLFVTEISAVD